MSRLKSIAKFAAAAVIFSFGGAWALVLIASGLAIVLSTLFVGYLAVNDAVTTPIEWDFYNLIVIALGALFLSAFIAPSLVKAGWSVVADLIITLRSLRNKGDKLKTPH